MNNKFLLNAIKYLLPFVAIILTFLFFRISCFITPIGRIQDDSIRWAIDLAFTSSFLYIVNDILVYFLKPTFIYHVTIRDRKKQSNVVLTVEEAHQPIRLTCNITLEKTKNYNRIPNYLTIHYPKWLTIQLNDPDSTNLQAVTHNIKDCSIQIDPNLLFNKDLINREDRELVLMALPRELNNNSANIEVKIHQSSWYHGLFLKKNVEQFNIKVIGEL